MTDDRNTATKRAKDEAKRPLHQLQRLMYQLADAGDQKEADKLDQIIARLEKWVEGE